MGSQGNPISPDKDQQPLIVPNGLYEAALAPLPLAPMASMIITATRKPALYHPNPL